MCERASLPFAGAFGRSFLVKMQARAPIRSANRCACQSCGAAGSVRAHTHAPHTTHTGARHICVALARRQQAWRKSAPGHSGKLFRPGAVATQVISSSSSQAPTRPPIGWLGSIGPLAVGAPLSSSGAHVPAASGRNLVGAPPPAHWANAARAHNIHLDSLLGCWRASARHKAPQMSRAARPDVARPGPLVASGRANATNNERLLAPAS